MDYRIYCLITVLAWGVWGFGAKMVAERLPGGGAPLLTGATSVLCIACYVLHRRSSIPLNRYSAFACVTGGLSALAVLALYKALERGPVSVVIPFTGLYVLVTVVLGLVFLREQVTPSRIAGVLLAALAIFLLSR